MVRMLYRSRLQYDIGVFSNHAGTLVACGSDIAHRFCSINVAAIYIEQEKSQSTLLAGLNSYYKLSGQ